MKLPRINAEKMIGVVERCGFFLTRQSGSHRIYRNKKGKRITIPYHSGKILHPKLVSSILNDLEITPDEFRALLKD